MNQQPIDVQAVAFTLLAQVGKTDTAKLTHAFDVIDDYTTYYIQKRTGGFRTISEPHEDLKKIQRSLLLWLYRIQKRTEYYRKHRNACRSLFYSPILKHSLDGSIHGSVPRRSTATAARELLGTDNNFVIELDLKDAFPSVKRSHLHGIIRDILITECKSCFYTYQERRAQGKRGSFFDRRDNHYDVRYDRSRRDFYSRYPLFTSKQCFSFRKLIRDQVIRNVAFEQSCIPEIIDLFSEWFTSLVSYQGCLPQGAPTSGFLLNLVLSQKGISHVYFNGGIYVDNFLISTMKKPDQNMIDGFIESIERSNIFTVNLKKTKVYDLRNHSAPVLGMKVVKRFARSDEFPRWRGDYTRGMKKRLAKNGQWSLTHLSLSQKKQKQYRAFLHNCIVADVSEETMAKAHGYLGHLVSVYGWPASHMPSCLKKVVQLFRDNHKFKKATYLPET